MKYREIILVTILFLLTVRPFSQTIFNTESKDSTNIYSFSLNKYYESLGNLKETTSIVYVEDHYSITKDLPNQIMTFEIKYMDQIECKKYLKGKKNMTLVRILPLQVKGNEFFVNVIPYEVSYKKNNFNYVNGGGLKVMFEFDESMNGLKFKAANWGGI